VKEFKALEGYDIESQQKTRASQPFEGHAKFVLTRANIKWSLLFALVESNEQLAQTNVLLLLTFEGHPHALMLSPSQRLRARWHGLAYVFLLKRGLTS
jgi:hypothetical protein